MSSEVLLIHVDGISRGKFFSSLWKNLSKDELAITAIFITESKAAHKFLSSLDLSCFLISNRACTKKFRKEEFIELYNGSLCGRLGSLNKKTAAQLYEEIVRIWGLYSPRYIWCWNGTKFVDRVLKNQALNDRIVFKVFETANIPGHFVIEDSGVNAESLTYARLMSGEAFGFSKNFDLDSWLLQYKKEKEENKQIPQASLNVDEAKEKLREIAIPSRITLKYFCLQVDRIAGYCLKSLLGFIIGLLAKRSHEHSKVIFFPQQVSTDSQLLFNSEINNIEALKNLIDTLPPLTILISNLHPAEHRLSQILRFLFLCLRFPKLIPARGGAWTQLKHCDEVVTINSTVGLEAAILGKPCRFLGRSYFQRLSNDRKALGWYISNHIVSYRSVSNSVDQDLVKRLLSNEIVSGY